MNSTLLELAVNIWEGNHCDGQTLWLSFPNNRWVFKSIAFIASISKKGTINKGLLKWTEYWRKNKLIPHISRKLLKAIWLLSLNMLKIDNLEIQKRIKVTVKKYRWSAYNGDITLSNHVWMQCPPGTHPCIYYFFLGTNCVYDMHSVSSLQSCQTLRLINVGWKQKISVRTWKHTEFLTN